MKKEKIELLLVAGDLFHGQPLMRECRELNFLLEQIPDLENNYLIVYGDSKGDSQLLKYANESHYRAL